MKEVKKAKKNGHIYHNIITIAIFPVVVLAILVMFFITYRIKDIVYSEVEDNLRNIAASMNTYLNLEYPGDYVMYGDDTKIIFKGDAVLNDHFEYIDELEEISGAEISLFYEDIRVLSTITDVEGNRILGMRVNSFIANKVIKGNEASFFKNVNLGDDNFYAYYMPLINSNGKGIGMIGVAKSSEKIRELILDSIIPIIIIVIFITSLVAFVCMKYAGRLSDNIKSVQRFMKNITNGELHGIMDKEVFVNNDEVSEIASSAVDMQESLRKLVEEDPLTELNNRRYTNKQLRLMFEKSAQRSEPLAVAIGDIDFFKKVNDTYGHEAGDVVLKNVAKLLKESMVGYGFASRWGGEEFLLCFSRASAEKGGLILEEVLDKIRALENYHDDRLIKITMSFGVADNTEADINAITSLADSRLYYAKEHGRDQVVYTNPPS